MRLFALLFLLGSVGCGSSATVVAPLDMSAPLIDLAAAGGNGTCGVDGVRQSCGGSCAACLYFGGGGVCVQPCASAQPAGCPSGQSCHVVRGSDGGAVGVQFDGTCAAFDGYCG